MNIIKNIDNSKLTFKLEGRLDTTTAPQLEAELKALIGSISMIIMDFSNLEYLSSAGLRVLLSAQKQMNAKNGKMLICHVNETVMDIFEVTGFVDILTIL